MANLTESTSIDLAGTDLDHIVEALEAHHPDGDAEVVRRAFAFLEEQRARVEDPRPIGYPLDTAGVLARLRLDPAAVAAALVAHVVVEHRVEPEVVREALGEEVGNLLEGVQRLATIRWDRIEEEAAETLRKMFLAMAQDIRVVMVVLAMRVQGMRSLRDRFEQDEEERARYARETLDVFAPLANRLGIWQLKWELEDWSLRELEPEAFGEITRLLAERREERLAFIAEVVETIEGELADAGIRAGVKGRAKHVYSIYKKMQRKDLDFGQLYDISAVRVITERLQDCYAALGIIHATFVPVPSEFDDYVAKPKDNGYQSLHTAVIGPRGRPVEVQIRTREMHQLSEFGVAAHWAYKERGSKRASHGKFMLLRQLMDWEREVADPHDFVESLKTDIFEDQVYVFTPDGDVVDLPVGSTPLDFAYRIHTMVGHRCRGARVNGQIVTLDKALATGDRIEILTHKEPRPSRDWMNPSLGYLKTASARGKVRGWYRKQGREQAVHDGRELIEREIARLDLSNTTLEEIAESFEYAKVEDLYAAVGYGDRSPASVTSAGLTLERRKAPAPELEIPSTPPPEPKSKGSPGGLRMGGVDEVMGRRAKCCNPVPGDDVVGFVTRGRGVVIHQRGCRNIAETREPERLVDIDWGGAHDERHAVDVEVRAVDRSGLLGELSRLITATGVNINSAKAEGDRAGASLRLSLDCRSADQVALVLERIDRHPDVIEVRRVTRS